MKIAFFYKTDEVRQSLEGFLPEHEVVFINEKLAHDEAFKIYDEIIDEQNNEYGLSGCAGIEQSFFEKLLDIY